MGTVALDNGLTLHWNLVNKCEMWFLLGCYQQICNFSMILYFHMYIFILYGVQIQVAFMWLVVVPL